jgi:hypothetical protein
MDIVSGWKSVSIALTGVFGILGLLTEFKNKDTKKITGWGWVSLTGIVLSSVCGVAVQRKETIDASKRAADNLNRAVTTLQNTSQTVTSMNRFMATLVGATVDVDYSLDCALKLSEPCGGTPASQERLLAEEGLEVYFFADSVSANRFTDGAIYPNPADLTWQLKRNAPEDEAGSFGEGGTATSLFVKINGYTASPSSVFTATGKILSLLDIPGSTVIITGNQDQLNDVPVRAIRIWIKDGRSVSGGPFERIIIHPKKPVGGRSIVSYRYAFPK